MGTLTLWYLLAVGGIFASACSQTILKKSADSEHENIIASILNIRVIVAYLIFFCSLFINITALSKGVNLKDIPILEALGYVFVPLLSYVFLEEKISKRTFVCICFILAGIYIFYL